MAAGDEIASQVEHALYKHIELLRRAYVHYHPASISQADSAKGCLVGEYGQ